MRIRGCYHSPVVSDNNAGISNMSRGVVFQSNAWEG
jgi:hypothetical protein